MLPSLFLNFFLERKNNNIKKKGVGLEKFSQIRVQLMRLTELYGQSIRWRQCQCRLL